MRIEFPRFFIVTIFFRSDVVLLFTPDFCINSGGKARFFHIIIVVGHSLCSLNCVKFKPCAFQTFLSACRLSSTVFIIFARDLEGLETGAMRKQNVPCLLICLTRNIGFLEPSDTCSTNFHVRHAMKIAPTL